MSFAQADLGGKSLFSAAFMAWVREAWPNSPDFVAIDGKTSRRSHDRGQGKQALHLVSAFATASRLVLGQEAVEGKSNELTAIPALLAKLAENDGLKGALVSIDAIATNANIAQTITDADGDYLLAVKANQPSLRAETESAFAVAAFDGFVDHDKGHGRIEQRTVSVIQDVDWLTGDRRFPGEFASPTPPRSSACSPAPSLPIAVGSRPAITSPRPCSQPSRRLSPCAAIGA